MGITTTLKRQESEWGHVVDAWKNTLFTIMTMLASATLFLLFMSITLVLGASLHELFKFFEHTPSWIKYVAVGVEYSMFAMETVTLLYVNAKQFARHFRKNDSAALG